MKKVFTVNVGDYGSIITLHEEKNVQSKVLISSINEANKTQIEDLFNKNKSVPVYIIADVSDQVYTKKSYPLINRISLGPIIKREKLRDYNKKTLLQSHFFTKNNIQKNWDCNFVSINQSAELEKWIEFLSSIDNRLLGIYSLPIEMVALSKAIIETIKTENNTKINLDTILFLIVQNKISGIRQVAIKNGSIVFTRVINYNFDDGKFATQFQKDIFRTNEYLRMAFPNLESRQFLIISILSDKINNKVKNIIGKEFSFFTYSPSEISKKLAINNALSSDESFSDIIIANIFVNNKKKILKFTNNKLSYLDRFYFAIKSLFFLNIFMAVLATIFVCKILYDNHQYNSEGEKISIEKSQLLKKIDEINYAASSFDKKTINYGKPEQIIDFGKINEALFIERKGIGDIVNMIVFIKKYNALISSFSYSLAPESKSNNFTSTLIKLSGDIYEKSGNIEQIIRNIDLMNLQFRKEFKDFEVKFSEIPKDVNFINKYYSLPIDIEIKSKNIKN